MLASEVEKQIMFLKWTNHLINSVFEMKRKTVNCCWGAHYWLKLQFLNVQKRSEYLYETVVYIPLCQKSSIYYLLVGVWFSFYAVE